MADITNILAMGPQPTTAWKSPLDLQQQQATLSHTQAATQAARAQIQEAEQLGRMRDFELQQKQEAERRAAADRDALARAAKEAAGDHTKLLPLAVQYGLSQTAAAGLQETLDKHAKSVAEMNQAQRQKADWDRQQVQGMLDPMMQTNDPIEQARLASVARARAKQLGVFLPDGGPRELQDYYHANGVAGSILDAAKKKIEAENAAKEGIAKEQLAIRQQAEFDTKHPVEAAIAADTLGDPKHLTPEQRTTANAAAARLAQDKAEADMAAKRIAETERHNRRSEELQARIAAGAGSTMPELANTPKPLQAPAAAAFSKAGIEYADAKAAADDIQAVIDLVRSGNTAAGSNLPLLGVGALNAINGIKRMNKAEIDQYAGAGSLWDSITGKVGKLAAGQPIPAEVLNDIEALHRTLAEGAKRKYQDKVQAINKSHNSNFKAEGAARMIRARDPQGVLHEAEEGTPLPAGWKLEGR